MGENARVHAAEGEWFDLTRFRLSDMIALGAALRRTGDDAGSLEEAASRVVTYLYDHVAASETGERQCVLVRLYKTHRFGDLDAGLQEFARRTALGHVLTEDTRCLVLLSTTGDEPAWRSRHLSSGHRAIPLCSERMVDQFPMISQLIRQLGIPVASMVRPSPDLLGDTEKGFDVFHVQDARGSPIIPAQEDFVVPYRVRSVIGFGGVLPAGELFSVIMFAKVPIPKATAELFGTIALSVKLALLPWVGKVFAE
ncbi:MAG: hypothetical protein HY698_16820 [Deltaproteobacteria bacterium]|nr:hypothetical protein [Deltaproteobacteria bacterium]